MEQAVGEDVAAFAIGGELGLVDTHEGQLVLHHRHRLGGAQQPARVLGLDALLAGDQRDAVGALDGDDPVIDLARQQAQREADRPARVRAKPLDREVGLAGVGRSKNSANAAPVLVQGVGSSNGHRALQCGIAIEPLQAVTARLGRLAGAPPQQTRVRSLGQDPNSRLDKMLTLLWQG
jgi:hypothetical protein